MANEKFGTDQAFWWDAQGGSSWRQAGLVTGGGPADAPEIEERFGINGEGLASVGLQVGGGSVEFEPCGDGWDLIDRIVTPTAGVFGKLKFAFDTGHREHIHQNCYVSHIELSVGAQSRLTCKFDWMYLAPRVTASPPADWDAAMSDPWVLEGFESGLTFGSTNGYADGIWSAASGVDLAVTDFTLQVDYPVVYTFSISGRSGSGSPSEGKRVPRDLVHNNKQSVTVPALNMMVPPTINHELDYPYRDIALSFSGTTNDGTAKTVAFSVPGMMWNGGPSEEFQPNDTDVAIWSCGLRWSNKKSSPLTYTVTT